MEIYSHMDVSTKAVICDISRLSKDEDIFIIIGAFIKITAA